MAKHDPWKEASMQHQKQTHLYPYTLPQVTRWHARPVQANLATIDDLAYDGAFRLKPGNFDTNADGS